MVEIRIQNTGISWNTELKFEQTVNGFHSRELRPFAWWKINTVALHCPNLRKTAFKKTIIQIYFHIYIFWINS